MMKWIHSCSQNYSRSVLLAFLLLLTYFVPFGNRVLASELIGASISPGGVVTSGISFPCPSPDLGYGISYYKNTINLGTVPQPVNGQCAGNSPFLVNANFSGNFSAGVPAELYIYFKGSDFGTVPTGLGDSDYYAQFSWNGTDWSGNFPIIDTTTHFTSFAVSTTTGTVNIQGYWNATTTNGIYEQLQFYQYDTIFGQQSFTTRTATTTGNFNWTFPYVDPPTTTGTTTAQFGVDTTFYAKIYQYNNNYFNDPFTGIIDPLYKTLLVATSTTMSPTALFYNIASTTALFAYPEYECGLTSMIGCIKNALIWAFYPTEDTITNYNSFLALIQEKPPIGYFTVVKNNLNNLTATSTSAFSVVLPYSLKHYIFDPFDVGLASILWFFFIFNFYKRLKHITI